MLIEKKVYMEKVFRNTEKGRELSLSKEAFLNTFAKEQKLAWTAIEELKDDSLKNPVYWFLIRVYMVGNYGLDFVVDEDNTIRIFGAAKGTKGILIEECKLPLEFLKILMN